MAKYNTKRTSICYERDNEIITNANEVFSFRADVEENPSEYWCGFYDSCNETYFIFPSGEDEIHCIEIEAPSDETLGEFETRIRNAIYDYCDEWVRLTKVADDCSCMEEMKWMPPKKVNGYGWDN